MQLSTVFNCFYFTLAIYLAAKSFCFKHSFLFLVILALLQLIVYVFIFLWRHGTGDSCLVTSSFASDYKWLILYSAFIGQMAEKDNLFGWCVAAQLSSCFLLVPINVIFALHAVHILTVLSQRSQVIRTLTWYFMHKSLCYWLSLWLCLSFNLGSSVCIFCLRCWLRVWFILVYLSSRSSLDDSWWLHVCDHFSQRSSMSNKLISNAPTAKSDHFFSQITGCWQMAILTRTLAA